MRDAFGGVFTINLFLVFIFIYVAFTAVSLNYARAFRVKNSVIDFVEQNEITDLDAYFGAIPDGKNEAKLKKLSNILENAGYYKECSQSVSDDENSVYCYKGIVIEKIKETQVDGTTSKIIEYQIKTYADWNLGALNKLLALAGKSDNGDEMVNGTWSIEGSAKVVAK